MSIVYYPNQKCKISDDWKYKDMQVVVMENDLLKISILAGRGGDIFEFKYNPKNVDFMLRLPKGIQNPNTLFSQMRNTSNQLEDYYYGGWQIALPNSPTFNYRGALLGQHGEVCLIPWKYSILDRGPQQIKLKLWTKPLRIPILIERTLTLSKGSATLQIEENIVNESGTHLDIMWGQHIAFGLPFLNKGAKVQTSAKKWIAEEDMPSHRRFTPGIEYDFPIMKNVAGVEIDGSKIPPKNMDPYSELCYLSDFEGDAYYSIVDQGHQIGFRLDWDKNIFKYLWFWQERLGTQDAPWWGDAYAVALEPWTSKWTETPHEEIKKGDWLKIEAGESISTEFSATAFEKDKD
jgi:galactose mutarotase-like enzyme